MEKKSHFSGHRAAKRAPASAATVSVSPPSEHASANASAQFDDLLTTQKTARHVSSGSSEIPPAGGSQSG